MADENGRQAGGSPKRARRSLPYRGRGPRSTGFSASRLRHRASATELRAGLATFLTMAYIMFVNPAILEKAGMDHGACSSPPASPPRRGPSSWGFTRTIPSLSLPAWGLNAYFAFTVVPELGGNWQLALVPLRRAVLLAVALAIAGVLIDAIRISLKLGIAAGIGFFLALIGSECRNRRRRSRHSGASSAISRNRKPSLSRRASCSSPGSPCGRYPRHTRRAHGHPGGGRAWARALYGIFAAPPSLAPTFLQDGSRRRFPAQPRHHRADASARDHARHGGDLDRRRRQARLRRAVCRDSARRCSPIPARRCSARHSAPRPTPLISAAAGVEEGGRTGLTAIFVALFFLLVLFLAPLANTVPLYATAPALLFVAFLMAASLARSVGRIRPITSPR